MSSKTAPKLGEHSLLSSWRTQRERVDAWEASPYPTLEWPEIREFVSVTASTLSRIVGQPNLLEQDLIQLMAFYLQRHASGPGSDADAYEPAGSRGTASETWASFRRLKFKGGFVDTLSRLHAYGVIGTWLDDDLPANADIFLERIRADLKVLDDVLAVIPKTASGDLERASSLDLRTLRDIAAARLAVDEGINDAPAGGLAWLGRVSVKTIQNMLSRRQLTGGAPGSVECSSARRWISSREWTQSCWRDAIEVMSRGLAAPFQDLDMTGAGEDASEKNEQRNDWVFVPRSKDGSLFTPRSRRPRGWTVGPRGQEQSFSDYWKALAFLQTCSRPCWRRANSTESFGIVVGQDWVRISRDELDLQLRAFEAAEAAKP